MKRLLTSNFFRGLLLIVIFFVSTQVSFAAKFADKQVISGDQFTNINGQPTAFGDWKITSVNNGALSTTHYTAVRQGANSKTVYILREDKNGNVTAHNGRDYKYKSEVDMKTLGDFWAQELTRNDSTVEVFIEDDGGTIADADDLYIVERTSNGDMYVHYVKDGDTSPVVDKVSTKDGISEFTRNHGSEFDETNIRFENLIKDLQNAETDADRQGVGRSFGINAVDGSVTGSGTIGGRVYDRGKTFLLEGLNEVVTAVIRFISVVMLAIGSFVLWLAAMVMNFMIYITVFKVSTFLGPESAGVNAAWTAFRDLANIAFIFILLYISISTILQLGGTNTKQLLGRVIITALLLNFSMFFTKVIIDGSNILALSFHNQISLDGGTKAITRSEDPNESLEKGIGGAFMKQLGVTSIYKAPSSPSDPVGALLFGFFGMVIMLITAIAFFAASAVLFSRLIMLIIYVITPPIAFVSTILPKTKGFAAKWWSGLIGQALAAPVFFIMMWVVFTVLNGILSKNLLVLSETGRKNERAVVSWESVFSGGQGATTLSVAEYIMHYMIVIGLIFVAIWATRKTSASSGSLAVSITKSAGKAIGWATLGRGAWLARRTVGSRATAIMEGDKYRGSGFRDRMVRGAATKLSGSSLDVRAATGISSLLGATGTDLGAGKEGGFVKDRSDAVAKTAKAISAMDQDAQQDFLGVNEKGEHTEKKLRNILLGNGSLKAALKGASKEHSTYNEKKNRLKEQHEEREDVGEAKRKANLAQTSLKDLENKQKIAIKNDDTVTATRLVGEIENQRREADAKKKALDRLNDELKDGIKELEDDLKDSRNKRKRWTREIIRGEGGKDTSKSK